MPNAKTWFSNQPPPAWPRYTEPLDQHNIAAALALLMATG